MQSSVSKRWSTPCAVALAGLWLTGACGAKSTSHWDRADGTSAGGNAGSTTVGAGGSAGSTLGQGGTPNGSAGRGASGGVGGAGGEPPECARGIPGTSQIPRLTPEQYDRTIRDLLAVERLSEFEDEPPSVLLGPDSRAPITAGDWNGYLAAAGAIARQVMADESRRQRFYTCPAGADPTACLSEAIVRFGRRAFRRPLTESELERFESIAARGAEITETGTSEEVAEALLETFLVSPSFLQRAELAEAEDGQGNFVLSPFEVAARLSYLLWGSTPDTVLDEAADAGALATREQIRAQAERMLADDKARGGLASFHRFYASIDTASRWTSLEKDPERFRAFGSAVARAMTEETERFFAAVVFERGGRFGDFFTSPLAFVNAATAPIYGLDAAEFGAELEPVELDPDERPGFLTRIGFLSAYAGYSRTVPALRGAFITRDVLGIAVGNDPSVGPLPAGEYATNRERYQALTADPACAGCHATYIDPPGFVLEAYDAVGARQTQEADTGAPIDTAADISLDGETQSVANPSELMQLLATSTDARREYVRDWLRFAYQREIETLDGCTIEELAGKLTDNGYGVLDLVKDLTETDAFRLRVVATEGP